MKILHTADWHLGKRLEKFSRLDEQRRVLNEIVGIAEEEDVDVVLIAGDLFDNYNPSTEAVELFYRTLKRLTNQGQRLVVAIAGNHDSPDRIEAPDPLAKENGILFIGYPDSTVAPCELESGICITRSEPGFIEVKLPRYEAKLRLLLTPYANEYRMRVFLGQEDAEAELRSILEKQWKGIADRYCDDKGVNIMMMHLFLMKEGAPPPVEPEDEKPILHIGGAQAVFSKNIPSQIQYVALGHLHRYQKIDDTPCPMVYSSSPLSYSFAEAGQEKFVVILDAQPGKPVDYRKRGLTEGRTLQRKRFASTDEALNWLYDHPDSLVELTLVSDDYISSEDRRRLFQAHDGIITLIPEIKNKAQFEHDEQVVDLQKSVDELFKQYFRYQIGHEINQELFELFKEVRSEQNEE
ncbi:metallophosphoesterase family protein [Albibacterium indicum]|uniref:metallophosphoesterase family protein n=1 Tax=Albibacterium indicum TaxID=2292082 RepID=UPI000E50D7A8|nr:exonuclease subunit SbcD [Pedobacter indicus]